MIFRWATSARIAISRCSFRFANRLATKAAGGKGGDLSMSEHVQDLVQFHGSVVPAIDADIAGTTDLLESAVGVSVEVQRSGSISLP